MSQSGKICNKCGRSNTMIASHCIECKSNDLSFDIENKARKYSKHTNNDQGKSDRDKACNTYNNTNKIIAMIIYGLIALAIFTDNNTLFLAFIIAIVMTVSTQNSNEKCIYAFHFKYQLMTIFIYFIGIIFTGIIAGATKNYVYLFLIFPLWLYIGYLVISGFILLINNKGAYLKLWS